VSARKVPSNAELKQLYEVEGLNSREIAELCGASKASVCRALRNAGVKMRELKGENHGSWKGGRTGKGDGYIGIWKPYHERADNQGYVYEHTLVIEEVLGRLPIKGEEVVHHINLEKTDNRPENLYLCGYREHTKLHRQLDRLIGPLLEKGVIRFDSDKGEYVLVEG
jgi:hypothetical protein